MNKVTKQNEKCIYDAMYSARIRVNTITNESMDSYINYVFGESIPDTIKKDLSALNNNVPLNKVLFLFAVFCERTAVLSIESINYYNFIMDNLMVNNTIKLPSIYKDDTIKCKYHLNYRKKDIYEISCDLLDENLPPIVHGIFCIDPSTFIIDENNENVADHINVRCSTIMAMIDLAMINITFRNQINNNTTKPSEQYSLNESLKDEEDKSLKYLPILWEKGINIEFYGDWLLAVTCSSCGDDLIIRSIDDFFNEHFGELDGNYTLEDFLRELEVKSSVSFVLDTDILDQFSDRDLKNIGAIISHINGCGTKLSIRISSTDYNFIYTINGTDYDSVYKAKEYINNEYGFLNIMCPEYITIMCVIFENIGVAEFLKNINKEANNQLKYLPALCEQGIDVTFYGNWLLGFTNPTNGDEVVIYSIDDFFNEHFGKLNSDHGLKEFVDELKDSTVPFMSDEYIIYNFDRIDLNNIGDIISHINGLGVGIDAYTVKNKNDDGYYIVYDINTNEGDIYETIEYISAEYGFNKDDIHPEYIAAMYVIFYDIGVGKFLTKIGYEPKAE